MNPNRPIAGHVILKMAKVKYKEKILKAAREKATNNIQGIPHKVNN